MEKTRHTQTPQALWVRLSALLLLAAALALGGCDRPDDGPPALRVACLVPGSGGFEDIARSMERAARLAVDQANAQGGAPWKRGRLYLELSVLDNGNTVEGSMDAVRRAVTRDGASVMVGGVLSRNAIPMARLADELRVPLITPGSSHPDTTRGKTYVWRMAFTDPFQGRVMARYARADLGAARAAVLADSSNDYSRALAESFSQAFTALGGRVTAYQTYVTGQRDLSEALARIARTAPDVLFLPCYHLEAADQARQARTAGIRAALLGGDGWGMLQEGDLKVLEGAAYCSTWAPETDSQETRAFADRYTKAYGEAPDSIACLTWDAFGLLFAAMEGVDSTDPAAIRQGLAQVRELRGAGGLYRYPAGGDPERSAMIMRITEGRKVFSKQLWPEP